MSIRPTMCAHIERSLFNLNENKICQDYYVQHALRVCMFVSSLFDVLFGLAGP